MKIGFLYGDKILYGRWIDFSHVWDSPRGLTGSELSCLCFAREMKRRGHDVSLFIHNDGGPSEWDGVKLFRSDQIGMLDSSYDVAYSWNEPDLLRGMSRDTLKMVNQQLNDFNYAQAGFDEFVDVYTSPSESHKQYHMAGGGSMPHLRTTDSKWEVLSNGCDPDQYRDGPRIPGSVIYAS